MFSKIVNHVSVSLAAVLVVGAMVVASADTARAQDSANKAGRECSDESGSVWSASNNNYPQPMTGAGYTPGQASMAMVMVEEMECFVPRWEA